MVIRYSDIVKRQNRLFLDSGGDTMDTGTRLVMTVEEAGELLGISRPHAYKLVREGQIPVLRLGRRLVVPRIQLERMLAGAKPSEG
jgi:excisionase family DNA binding protein